jgi:hypothetical protein
VERLPDPENLGHLATVLVHPGTGDAQDAALVASIERRRTDRRRMSHRPVPSRHIETVAMQASRAGAVLLGVTGPLRRRLTIALADAAHIQAQTPGCVAEPQLWTHRHAGGHDRHPPR